MRLPTNADAWFLLKADIESPEDELRLLRDPDSPDLPPETARLATAIAAAVGVPVASVEPETRRGTFHWVAGATLTDGREVIAKINRLRHPVLRAGLAMEARLPRLLHAHGVAAASVVGADAECLNLPTEMMVSERLEGVALAEVDDSEAAVHAGLRSLGTVLRGLHEIRLPGAGPLRVGTGGELRGGFDDWRGFVTYRLEEHVARCRAIGALTSAEAERATLLVTELEFDAGVATDRLLHGDPGPANALTSPEGEIRLVDWEDAMVGDPVFDLSSAAAFQPERRWPPLFQGYGWDAGSDARLRRFWIYMLRISLARTVMRHRFGLTDAPGRPPAAGRIRRALERLELREVG